MTPRDEYINTYFKRVQRYAFVIGRNVIQLHPEIKDDLGNTAVIKLIELYDIYHNEYDDPDTLFRRSLFEIKYHIKKEILNVFGSGLILNFKSARIINMYKSGSSIEDIIFSTKYSRKYIELAIQTINSFSLDMPTLDGESSMSTVIPSNSEINTRSYKTVDLIHTIKSCCKDNIDDDLIRLRYSDMSIAECSSRLNISETEVNDRLVTIFMLAQKYLSRIKNHTVFSGIINMEDEWDRVMDAFNLQRITLEDVALTLGVSIGELFEWIDEIMIDPNVKKRSQKYNRVKLFVLKCRSRILHEFNVHQMIHGE